MNAYEFYLSTCKYVLFADPTNKSTWADLYGYLPCLRQMLSCCVCGNIMLKPKGPGHGICLHHVCASCIGGKMRLRPACSWCRTHEGFIDNPGMRILVLCFKKMCEYINSSPIGVEIRKAATNGAHTNTLIKILDEASAFEDDYVISNKVMPTCVPTYGMAPEPKLVSLPRGPTAQASAASPGKGGKGRVRSDSTVSTNSQSDKDTPPKLSNADAAAPKATVKDKPTATNGPLKLSKFDDELQLENMPALLAPCTRAFEAHGKLSPPLAGPQRADVLDQQGSSRWSQSHHGAPRGSRAKKLGPRKSTSVKIMAKATKQTRGPGKSKLRKGSLAQQTQLKIRGRYQKKQKNFKHEIDFEPPCKRTRLASSLGTGVSATPQRKVCKCARLNAPTRLTCFGQRCPCYSSCLPCIDCMCRGCRNPRKQPSHPRHDDDRSDAEHDPPMPRLSPEPRM
ncbi:hypothetical protein BaRGS_00024313 [Batillaria attramentaria]|uniref:CXC MSL2-type domain-containing protein n=1 Tax=Batillaria attramentaria TaxID=370345 RepID=A0ABD0KBE1_9CAEN